MSEDEDRPAPPAPSAAQRKRAQQQATYRRRRAVALAIAVVVLIGAGIAIAAIGGGDDTTPAAASGASGGTAKGATTGTSTGGTASTGTSGSTAAAGATGASTARETPTGPPIAIGWAGDSIPASEQFGLPDDPSILLGDVASLLEKPDLMIVNLEGTLTNRGTSKCSTDSANCYAFRAPPSYAKSVFKAAGVDATNLANNHANDFGPVGRRDTRSSLRNAGIAFSGGPNEVTVVDVKGIKVALIGLAPYPWAAPLNDNATIATLVKRAAADADLVVVMIHAGAEGASATHVPHGHEQAFGEDRGDSRAVAHLAIDNGADLVVGSGPHVLRGMEFYKGHLIAYSLGNLVGYGGAFATGGTLSLSGIVRVTLKPDGTYVTGTLDPLVLTDQGTPQPDPTEAAHGLVRQLSKEDFGKSAATISTNGTISPP